MADGPSLRDVTKLLDNPAVSDEVKRGLISGYTNEHWDSAEDLRRYAEQLGMPSAGLFPGHFGFPDGDLDKALDQAHKQIDKHDAVNGQHALGESSTSAANSNAILDHGAPGLRYFEYFAPLYQKCVGGTDISSAKARDLYDEQRDMNFAALRADGDTLTQSAAKLAEEITTQRNAWNTIDQLWTGQGAESANSYVGGYLRQARTAQSQVDRVAKVLSPVADALEQAVHDKATFVAHLYADTVGGKSPAQIEEIIYYAQHGHDIFSSLPVAVRILQMFGMSVAPSAGTTVSIGISPVFGASGAASDLLEKAKRCATNFVDNVFVPDVEATWRGLVDVCTATDKSVRETYQFIVAESNSINDHPFTAVTTTLPPMTSPAQNNPAPKPAGEDQTAPTSAEQPGGGGAEGVPTELGGGQAATPVPPVGPPPGSPAASTLTPSGVAPSDSLPEGAVSPGAGTPMPTSIPPSQMAATPYLSSPTGTADLPPADTSTGSAPGSGVAWLRNPSTLPPGWTINPSTAELMPPGPDASTTRPGAPPVATGFVPAEPPPITGLGAPAIAGSTVPPGEAPPSITITDGRSTLTVAAEAAGAQGIDITITDPAGSVSRYTVEMGENGLPQLTADPPLPADLAPTLHASVPEPGPAGSAVGAGPVADGSAQLVDAAASLTGAERVVAGTSDEAPAGQPLAAAAPADEPVQVRAASAVGWGEAAKSTTDAGTAAVAPPAPAPDAITHGGYAAMGHAHADPGLASALGSAGLSTGSSQMSGLHGDLFPAATGQSPGDQWLLEGTFGGDTEWSSLASVLSSEPGRHLADTNLSAWPDKPEEPAP